MNNLNESRQPGSVVLVRHPNAAVPQESYYVVNSPYGFEAPEDSESDSSLLAYWRLLRRHKWTIALAPIAGLVLGIAVGIPMKPVFRAATSLEVLNLNDDFMNMKQSSPVTTTDYSFDVSEEETQAKLLQADALLGHVVTKLDPDGAKPRPKPHLATTGWRSWLHLPDPPQVTEREKLLSKAALSLKVRPTPRTRVLDVSVDSTDPQLAADFANTIVQEYIQESVERRRNTTQGTSDWLSREMNDARTNLQRSEDALQTYARNSGLIFTDSDETTSVATEKLQQVQQELSVATADRIAKQSRFELAKNAPPESLPDVLNDDALRQAETNADAAQAQVAQLSAIYTPDYSKLKQAQAQLATLQSALAEQRAAILKRIENDYHESVRKEKLLAAAYDAQTREVTGLDEKAIQYNILKREVDSNRQLYDTMLQEMKQSSIASAMHASNVRIVDPASIPDKPVFPNFKTNAALGFLLGLFGSIGFVILRERADRTLQQPGDIKLWTDLSELGTIPSAETNRKSFYYNRAASAVLEAAPAVKRVLAEASNSGSVELITWNQKPSVVAEAFRSALTSILFIGENGSRPRVLVFTSANAADGKTTTVSNLAIATAEIRHKVLVIDADLRRPRMHQIFNLPNDRGLADLLRDDLSEEAVASLVQETDVPGLHVLAAGQPTHAAAHLLYSPNFAALLARFKKEYDMILIDTPPMLQMTDARVVSRIADAVVLVARAGQTTRDAIVAAKQRFAEDRIRVLGTILNDWDPKRGAAGYYGYRSGYYYNSYARYQPDAATK